MEEEETIEPECTEIKREHVIKIDNNKLKIEMDNDIITFILRIGISYYKYIKRYNYNEIIKELNIFKYEDKEKEKLCDYLINSEYKIINDKNKKIIINKKEIELIEKKLTDKELMQILIDEIIEIKEKNKQQDEKINKLIKENKLLKTKCNEFEKHKKDINEIKLIYKTEEEGN